VESGQEGFSAADEGLMTRGRRRSEQPLHKYVRTVLQLQPPANDKKPLRRLGLHPLARHFGRPT